MQGFNLPVITRVLRSSFRRGRLLRLRSDQLLRLTLGLGLIGRSKFFFLSRYHRIHGGFSTTRPAVNDMGSQRFAAFLGQYIHCTLTSTSSPGKMSVKTFVSTIGNPEFGTGRRSI